MPMKEEGCIKLDTIKIERLEEVVDIMQINYYGKKQKI